MRKPTVVTLARAGGPPRRRRRARRLAGALAPAAALLLVGCVDLFRDAGADAPDGAIWTRQTIEHIDPPPGYAAVLAWAQAVTTSPDHDPGREASVRVDWWELLERRADGTELVVYREDYDDAVPRALRESAEGGLFVRSPRWFATNDFTAPTNTEIRDGGLTVRCDRAPDRVTHWWTRRVRVTPGARYVQRMQVRISGEAWLQLGGDWWRTLDAPYAGYSADCTTSNNCESYVSDWYSEADSGGRPRVVTAPVLDR